MRVARVTIVLIAIVFAAVSLQAGVDTILAHGVQPNSTYQVSQFDAVNTFSGDLNVNVPFGPKYATNGTLSYQFALHHSRDVWAYVDRYAVDTAPGTVTTTVVDAGAVYDSAGVRTYRMTFTLDAPEGSGFAGSEPVPAGNAGMGWDVGFGSYGAVPLPESYLGGKYTDESGAAHEFHPSMHSTSYNDVGASFTQDGSYLRLRIVASNTNEREVDFPNGTVKHFSCVSGCGTRKAQWILRWIADPFGNVLVIERSSDTRPASGQWIWTFIEGTLPDAESRSDPYYHGSAPERTSLIVNRQHRLTFDIYGNFAQTDYPWIGERLSKAELAGPGGDFSMVFTFGYDPLTMLRTPVLPWTKDGLFFPYNSPSHTTTFQMLTSMTLPQGAGLWQFSYYPGSTDDGSDLAYTYCTAPNWNSTTPCPDGYAYPTSRLAGALKSVKAPTGGGYQYTYATRGLPVRLCTAQGKDARGYGGGATIGISKREEIDENGTVKATWRYSGGGYMRHFVDADHDGFDDGDLNKNGVYDTGDVPICRTPVEYLAAMLDPNGLLTIDYHNVAYGLAWYGAPFSPDPDRADTIQRHDGSQTTRSMSSETYSVDNSASSPFVMNLDDAVRRLSRTYRDDGETAPAATRLRAKYAVFDESGYDCSAAEGLPSDCRQINLRETSEHTRYYDDPVTITFGGTMTNQVPFTETVNSDFDGLGHFRQTNSYGTFKAAAKPQRKASDFDVRAHYTFFNPKVTWQPGDNNPTGMPDRLSGWLNELSSRTMVIENGRIGSTHTLFDPLRGYTKAVRRLKESTLATGVALIPDASGQVASLKNIDVGDGADDLLTVYSRSGQLSSDSLTAYEVTVREDSYGGDGGGLCTATSGECAWSGGQVVISAAAGYSSETASHYGTAVSSLYRGCGDQPFVHSSSTTVEHGAGLPVSVTDASGLTTSYTYDSLGRVTLVTPPGAATPQAYAYQSKTGTGGMNSLAITRSGGASTSYVYDYLGRLLLTTQDTPAGAATSAIAYTPTGQVLDQTPPLAVRSNHHSYDVFDRESSVRGADGHITDTSYVGGRGTVTLMHDVATGTSNHDVQISHDLDSFGRLFRANDNLLKAEYDYDALSNLTVVTLTDIAKGDTQTRRLDHDGRGFVNSETNPEMHGSGGQVIVKNLYDARGHVTSRDLVWSGGGNASALSHWSLRLAYDPAERLRDVWQPASTSNSTPPLKHIEYYTDFDAVGLRNQLASADRYNYVRNPSALSQTLTYKVSKAYAYDGCAAGSVRCGLLTQETTMSTVASPGGATPFLSGTVSYDYDARSNLIKVDYPTPFADAVARSINYGYTADVMTGVTEGAAHTPRASISFYKNGQRQKVQLANASAHDDVDLETDSMLARPGKMTWYWTGGSSTSDLYAYDGAGNISKIGSDAFQYDKALRLTSATVSSVPEGYTYDGFGNLTKRGNVSFTVGTSDNRISTVQGKAVTYDEAGDLISMPDARMLNPPDPSATLTFEYDALRMATYTDGNGIGRIYVYDPDDERAGVINFKAAGGIRELWSFRSRDHHVLRDIERKFTSGGPVWTWKKDHVFAGDLLTNTIARNTAGQVEVHDVHADHLGSVRFVTGTAGELLNASSSGIKFLPFGSLAFDQNLPERLAFTAHERDDDGSAQDEGDIDYMHARYYSPYLGRFLSLDPDLDVKEATRTPQSWSRYAYVRNNPINSIDPTGKYLCQGSTDECTAVEQAYIDIGTAAANLPEDSPERARLDAVLSFLGSPNSANGVTVMINSGTSAGMAGGTVTVTHISHMGPTGQTTRIGLNFANLSAPLGGIGTINAPAFAPELAATLAHEAQHGIDERQSGGPQTLAQEFALEVNAFTTNAAVYRGLNFVGGWQVWTRTNGFDFLKVIEAANVATQAWCNAGGQCH